MRVQGAAAEAAVHAAARATSASSRRRSRCRTSTRCGAQLGAERINLVGALVRHARGARVPAPVPAARCGAACSTASRRPTWRCRRASRPTTRPRSTRCSPPATPSRRARATTRRCARAGARCCRACREQVTARASADRARRALHADARDAARRRARRRSTRRRWPRRCRRRSTTRRAAASSRWSASSATCRVAQGRCGSRWACTSRSSAPRTCRACARSADKPGADFGAEFARIYERMCAAWPRGDGAGGVLHACRRAPAPVLRAERRRRPGDAAAPRRARRRARSGRRRATWSCRTPATA